MHVSCRERGGSVGPLAATRWETFSQVRSKFTGVAVSCAHLDMRRVPSRVLPPELAKTTREQ